MSHPSAAYRASGGDAVISDLSDDDISLDGAIPEESVLRLIEILEVPRHQAIEMLVQHEGDLEMAVVTFASL
ncbi:hypothetical protein DUNSADRAFT_9441 [Dunaliella salina]|uniref:Nascent polypeptide-associated complex subunit alpha-like UBA domain-containing protein n=1 Tax=Dunaliella salina TaxID=3046 RepID=A0ABQ7GHG4_DUNSA|nr:hypothetical protein DUNSADRAFT_9441 [Dunaliella salina]|eukprot:KAF5834050.1 hypothetical protein DUNSADRAFT_9441 [Dunaliella salina]